MSKIKSEAEDTKQTSGATLPRRRTEEQYLQRRTYPIPEIISSAQQTFQTRPVAIRHTAGSSYLHYPTISDSRAQPTAGQILACEPFFVPSGIDVLC